MQKILILAFIFIISISADQYHIKSDDILNFNIDFKSLNPSALGNDAKYLIATEKVYDIQKVSKGNVYNLVVFYFSNQKLSNVKRIPLQIYHLVNVAFDADKDIAYIFGDHGNKIIQVYFQTGEQNIIFEYKKGVSGFKSGPFAFFSKGNLYATGWFFNEDQKWQGDFVAQVVLPKKDMKNYKPQFKRKANLDYLYKHIYAHKGLVRNNYYVSGDVFFFNLIVPEEEQFHLLEFRNEEVRVVAKGHMIYIFCGTEDKLFYNVKNKDESFDHYLLDLHSDKKWKIGEKHDQYTYPFLVKDRLVVTKLNYDMKTFNAYVGTEKGQYLLKRFLRNESMGAMKISEDGKYYFLMNVEGFKIGTLVD